MLYRIYAITGNLTGQLVKRLRIRLWSCCCCCCSAYISSCHRIASDANLLDDPHTFHYQDYFVIGRIRTCLGVSDDPMFLWIFSNFCPLNLLLVRSHQAEIIIVKRLIQVRNNVTRVRVEPRSFDQGRHKNDAFTHSATLPWEIGGSNLGLVLSDTVLPTVRHRCDIFWKRIVSPGRNDAVMVPPTRYMIWRVTRGVMKNLI